MKTYGVYKEEWYADSCYEGSKEFTFEDLKQLYSLLQCEGGTELGYHVTGLTDDSYSDGVVEELRELWYECDMNREETIRRALEDKVIRTHETYHRCLNICCNPEVNPSPEELEKLWTDCLNIEIDNYVERV